MIRSILWRLLRRRSPLPQARRHGISLLCNQDERQDTRVPGPLPWGEGERRASSQQGGDPSDRLVNCQSGGGPPHSRTLSRSPGEDSVAPVAGLRMAAGCQPAIQPIANRRYLVTKPPSSRIAYLEIIKKWPESLVTPCGVL